MYITDVRAGDPRGFVGEECLALLAELQAHPIVAVRRIFYVYKGEVDRTKGWIEITFQGRSVLFREASDGYHLRAIPGRWVDPFEGPQGPENVSYIEQYGKLTAFDVSEELPYRQLIGQAAKSIEPLRDLAGEVVGFRLATDHSVMRAWVDSDEFYVLFTPW